MTLIEKEDIELKLKQIYLVSHSMLSSYLNQNSTLSGYKPVPADGEYALWEYGLALALVTWPNIIIQRAVNWGIQLYEQLKTN